MKRTIRRLKQVAVLIGLGLGLAVIVFALFLLTPRRMAQLIVQPPHFGEYVVVFTNCTPETLTLGPKSGFATLEGPGQPGRVRKIDLAAAKPLFHAGLNKQAVPHRTERRLSASAKLPAQAVN